MAAIDELTALQVAQIDGTEPVNKIIGFAAILQTLIAFHNTLQAKAADLVLLAAQRAALITLAAIQTTLSALATGLAALSGKTVLFGTASFTTTGTSKLIDIGALTVIDAAFAFPNATHADDERLWIGAALSSGDVNVQRAAASPTTGLGFWYLIIAH